MGKLRGWMKWIGWWALVFFAACQPKPWGTIPPLTVVPISTHTVTPAPTATSLPTSSPTPAYTPTVPPTATKTPTSIPTATKTPIPVDLAIQKTAQCDPATGTCTFTITVVNNGPGSYYGGVPTQDFISPTVPFTLTAFGGPGGTLCYLSGSIVNCSPHYPLNLSPGGTYTSCL